MIAPSIPHKLRVQQLQAELSSDTALLLTSPSAVQYFTGFVSLVPSERDGMVLITPADTYLIHSSFSPLPADISGLQRFTGTSPQSLATHFTELKKPGSFKRLVIDADTLTVSESQVFEKLGIATFPLSGTPLQDFLLQQRSLKDKSEVERIRQAAQITEAAVAAVSAQLRVGLTEREVKRLLEHAMDDAGASAMAFPSIVAFGSNSALPHHQPSDQQLVENTAVLIDVGARFDTYCADMTRTVWFGDQPSKKFLKIEEIVQRAYAAALAVVQRAVHQSTDAASAVKLKAVDQAARSVITDAGYGEQFNHTTGHGLGLDIHEHPSVNWKSEVEIKPNLVITVEPGIYLDGEFGYRYENTVLVEKDAAVELTQTT